MNYTTFPAPIKSAIPFALIAFSTSLSAVTFNNGGGNNFWGNDANWSAAHPDGVDANATIQTTTTLPSNRIILLADASGADQSFTVKTLKMGTSSGGGSAGAYQVTNVSGGTASIIF